MSTAIANSSSMGGGSSTAIAIAGGRSGSGSSSSASSRANGGSSSGIPSSRASSCSSPFSCQVGILPPDPFITSQVAQPQRALPPVQLATLPVQQQPGSQSQTNPQPLLVQSTNPNAQVQPESTSSSPAVQETPPNTLLPQSSQQELETFPPPPEQQPQQLSQQSNNPQITSNAPTAPVSSPDPSQTPEPKAPTSLPSNSPTFAPKAPSNSKSTPPARNSQQKSYPMSLIITVICSAIVVLLIFAILRFKVKSKKLKLEDAEASVPFSPTLHTSYDSSITSYPIARSVSIQDTTASALSQFKITIGYSYASIQDTNVSSLILSDLNRDSEYSSVYSDLEMSEMSSKRSTNSYADML